MARLTVAEEKEQLRSLVLKELYSSGWQSVDGILTPPKAEDKDAMRFLHQAQRVERARKNKWLVEKHGPRLIQNFADGSEICVENFSPRLTVVQSNFDAFLFRFSSLLWSIPVSQGYGRRMRYLVRDDSNGKLIGIFAIGDPVFNLGMRDKDIGWNSDDRKERLYHVMDAYVLGAVPPYNRLLGGKFVALAAISDVVRTDFKNKYSGQKSIIENKNKDANLVLLTTTSALGRSSIYNRISILDEEQTAYRSVGYSGGWGHFHFSDSIFRALRNWLRKNADEYADGHKFGQGPNWRLRTIRKGLTSIGFEADLLKHGIKREIFLAPLARNFREYLIGSDSRPDYYARSLEEISTFYKQRWLLPRSKRINDWRFWTRQQTWEQIAKNCELPKRFIMF